MKILVTGALGYIGSLLTGYLEEHGFDCAGYDTGFFQDCTLYEPVKTETIIKDVRLFEESDLEGIDVLVHLAGISNDPFGNMEPAKIYDPTREYSLHIAKLCKKMGVKFIFASSCSVYGIGQKELLNEESKTYPQTAYSLNKLQIEQDLAEISDNTFSPIALRMATVFGMSPRMRFDIVINMLVGMALTTNQIILNSDGTSWRPHVHIDDVCEAFRCCIEQDFQAGQLVVFNVGRNDNNMRVIDVARLIQGCLADCKLKFLDQTHDLDENDLIRDRKIQDGVDTRTYQVSFKKIVNTLSGYQCRHTVEKGIRRLLAELHEIGLNENGFKSKKYYRLQQIEYLYHSKQIDDALFWVK